MALSSRASRSERILLAIAAVASLVYFFSAFAPQAEGPDVETATVSDIRAFYQDNASNFQTNATMNALAMAAVLVFTVSLARIIRRREPGSPLADLVVGGGIMMAVWQWVDTAINSMTVVQSLDGTAISSVSDSSLVSWYAMTNASHLWGDLAMVPISIAMGAASLAAVRLRVLPHWLGWMGIVCSGGGFLGLIGVTTGIEVLSWLWFLGLYGWFLWVPLAGGALALQMRRSSDAALVSGDGAPAARLA